MTPTTDLYRVFCAARDDRDSLARCVANAVAAGEDATIFTRMYVEARTAYEAAADAYFQRTT